MKRNYLFLIATLFVIGMAFFLTSFHLLETPKKQPAYAPKRIERALPHFAP